MSWVCREGVEIRCVSPLFMWNELLFCPFTRVLKRNLVTSFWDVTRWGYRSIRFIQGIYLGYLAEIVVHPGVPESEVRMLPFELETGCGDDSVTVTGVWENRRHPKSLGTKVRIRTLHDVGRTLRPLGSCHWWCS